MVGRPKKYEQLQRGTPIISCARLEPRIPLAARLRLPRRAAGADKQYAIEDNFIDSFAS